MSTLQHILLTLTKDAPKHSDAVTSLTHAEAEWLVEKLKAAEALAEAANRPFIGMDELVARVRDYRSIGETK